VPADSPLAGKGPPLTLNDIAQLPLIGYRQCRTMTRVEAHLAARGIQTQIIFRSDDKGTVQGLVAAGMGVALVPCLTVEATDPRIAVLDLSRAGGLSFGQYLYGQEPCDRPRPGP
jgi:DNA-binding transcriptional LysR family regulator